MFVVHNSVPPEFQKSAFEQHYHKLMDGYEKKLKQVEDSKRVANNSNIKALIKSMENYLNQ